MAERESTKKAVPKKVELLSPAGSIEGFYGAVHAGADAVYLAGNRFGARAYAENFGTEELVKCIRYAHLLGRKIYLTVNTLLKESELSELYDYLLPFCEAGLDAVIVQDLGVLRFVREHFPQCRLHVSTQMTLCGSYGATLLKSMGACRIVPARELSLKELSAIKSSTQMEVETFVHGAMCYCYSGQCLFSSILGGRSGNRGRCAQPCRLPYTLVGTGIKGDACYPLSLKDMCTIEHIPALIEAGIDSFKIEGRMKKPEYAAGVTDIYRRCIDSYYELREKLGPREAAKAYKVEKKDAAHLSSLYIRTQVQDGYYFRRNGREMITLKSPAYSGSDESLLQKIRDKYLNEPLKLPVTVDAVFRKGTPAEVGLRYQDVTVQAVGEVVQPALKQPISQENVRKQLGKLGDSAFFAAKIDAAVEDDCFYSLKQINELRRDAVSMLEEAILCARGYGALEKTESLHAPADCREKEAFSEVNFADAGCLSSQPDNCHAFSVVSVPQLETLVNWLCANPIEGLLRIYVDGDIILRSWETVVACYKKLSGFSRGCSFYAALPYILRETDSKYLESLYKTVSESGFFHGFLVRSMDGLGFLREKSDGLSCRSDAGLYIWNHSALQELSPVLEAFCLPYELNSLEQSELLEKCNCIWDEGRTQSKDPQSDGKFVWEKIVYGRIPMMITANCLMRTSGSCLQAHKAAQGDVRRRIVLRDRQNKAFPVEMVCSHCMNIIYNSVPLSLHQRLSKWKNKADLRMDFTIESPQEVAMLLDTFLKNKPYPMGDHTTGHEKRGVE